MSLASVKCTNCGSEQQVDSEKEAMICSSCGEPIITQRAIDYYNSTHDSLAGSLTTYNDDFKDFLIRDGKLESYSGSSVNVVIPNSVTIIGDSAFKDFSALERVIIPNSVYRIEDFAFSGCSGLSNITIPYSVISIGNYAFFGCSKLSSIIIPNSVKIIGDYAFSNCYGLTNVTIPANIPRQGVYIFQSTPWWKEKIKELNRQNEVGRQNPNSNVMSSQIAPKWPTAKIVLGIISLVLFAFISFQSCVVRIGESLSGNGEVGGSFGVIVAFNLLVTGIIAIAARKTSSKVPWIISVVLLWFNYFCAKMFAGSYSDLVIWGFLSFAIGVFYLFSIARTTKGYIIVSAISIIYFVLALI